MSRQYFSVGREILGYREVPAFRNIPGFEIKPMESFAYFCPKCGEVWGRLRVEGATYWQCVFRNCREHGNGRLSMLGPKWYPNAVEVDWPRDALLREFLIELEDFVQSA